MSLIRQGLEARAQARTFGEAWDLLFAPPIAHRGLWAKDGAPENSLAAFQAACTAGYGIELDVRLSADGEAMVFHDDDLKRLTGQPGKVCERTAAELGRLRLCGTDEPVPTLFEALATIGHRALVLVELKTPYGEVGPLEQRVHDILIDHAGPTAVIGFNPYSHAWFADRFPGVLRGLDSYGYNNPLADRQLGAAQKASFRKLEHVAIARPHFLALGLDMLPSEPAAAMRANGMPVVAWTVRQPEQWARLDGQCDNLIFEGFRA